MVDRVSEKKGISKGILDLLFIIWGGPATPFRVEGLNSV